MERSAHCYCGSSGDPVQTRRNRGFTIIGLLVVMAIIGMLASIVLVALSTIQTKSRDTRRMEDIREIQKALSLYYVDNNQFPVATTAVVLDGTDAVSTALVSAGAIPAVPGDPVHPSMTYTYQTNTTGGSYTITFCLETDSIPNFAEGCGNTITP
ncbi:MAG: prepilin-type N-terminal cleavage/methylation domain-containing protein [bacterium]|nr:prepilin-type N-terminal cleavage/methylation domain-containing protein [bacterium]